MCAILLSFSIGDSWNLACSSKLLDWSFYTSCKFDTQKHGWNASCNWKFEHRRLISGGIGKKVSWVGKNQKLISGAKAYERPGSKMIVYYKKLDKNSTSQQL